MNRYDTTATIVWEAFTEAEFSAAARVSTTDVAGLKGTHRREGMISLPASTRDRYMTILRSREHEWTHFRQHFSTPFGVFHHRLLAVQELGAQMFFRDHPQHVGSLQVAIAAKEGESASGPLVTWHHAKLLAGALWSLNLPMHQLIALWESGNYLTDTVGWFRQSGEPRGLVSLRDKYSESVPNGVVSCESLVEGFAAYREAMELAVHFPREDFIGHVRRHLSPEAAYPYEYLRERLGIPFGHPLGGALQELAVAGFIDPAMAGPGEPLVWEAMFPSARFEQAVSELARIGPPYPERQVDAYELVQAVMALDDDPAFRVQWEAVSDEETRALEDVPNDEPDLSLQGLVMQSVKWHRSRFADALRLRKESPSVYYVPQATVPEQPEIWNEFVRVGAPPIVIGPEGVGSQGVSDSDAQALLVAALGAYAIDDFGRYGRFVVTIRLLEELARQDSNWRDLAHIVLAQTFPETYDKAGRVQVEKVFAK